MHAYRRAPAGIPYNPQVLADSLLNVRLVAKELVRYNEL